jgi:hypothetical protein
MQESQPRREGFLATLRQIICRLLDCEPQPQPQPQPKDKPIAFEPGKVVILTEFPPDLTLTPREIVDRVSARLARLQLDPPLEVNLAPERVIVLRSAQRTLATVTGDVPAARQSPRQLIRFISQLHSAIALPPLIPPPEPGPDVPKGDQYPQGAPTDQSQPPTGDNPAPSAGLAAEARAAQAPMLTATTPTRPATADAEGFDLRAASPNWLSSGAMNIGGGGPGAWPVSAPSVTPNPTDPQPWDFIIQADYQSPSSGVPVEVAILDTVPSLVDLQNAYGIWVGNELAQPPVPPQRVSNPLLRELLAGPNGGSFSVVDQTGTTAVGSVDQLDVLYQPSFTTSSLLNHPYPMASHGLFVAGIIRSLAPQAKLRMIQVLNENGVGTVESITQGLALADRSGRGTLPLVINCSFTLSIPRPGEDLGGFTQAQINQLTQLMHDAFVHVCQSPNVVIIAAAGNNEVVPLTGHPQARYPAAFDGVSGVAALTKDDLNPSTPDTLATYSDLEDDQPSEGFAAFGGDVVAGSVPLTADAVNGMLGVFIDQLPVALPPPTGGVAFALNTTGWARWSGTSFSAPVVSAIIANLISSKHTTALVARQLLGIKAPDVDVNNAVLARQVT